MAAMWFSIRHIPFNNLAIECNCATMNTPTLKGKWCKCYKVMQPSYCLFGKGEVTNCEPRHFSLSIGLRFLWRFFELLKIYKYL